MYINDVSLVFISIFVPPLAVWLRKGFYNKDTGISLFLFIIGFFPSLIHALYIISFNYYENDEDMSFNENVVNMYGSLN